MKVFRAVLGFLVLLTLVGCAEDKNKSTSVSVSISAPVGLPTGMVTISAAFPKQTPTSNGLMAPSTEWLRVLIEETSGFFVLVDLTPASPSALVTVPVGTYCITAAAWKKVVFPYGFQSVTFLSNAEMCGVIVAGGQTTTVPDITLEDATIAFSQPSAGITYGQAVTPELAFTNVPSHLARAAMDFTLTNVLQPSFPATVLYQPLCALQATTGTPATRSCTSAPIPLSPNPSPVNIKAEIDGSKWARDFGAGPTLYTEADGIVLSHILIFSGDSVAQ